MRVSRASAVARDKPAIRNQPQTPASGSLLPSREKARMRVSRASAVAGDKPAIRNQPQTPASGSLLPSREKARMRVSRASAAAGDKPAIRNQPQTPASGSLLPSREKARMRVTPRPNAALRAGDALAPFPPSFPVVVLRHSRESGNPDSGEQPSRPEPSAERTQQIPSPFTGEG